jgi:hypothetical protein
VATFWLCRAEGRDSSAPQRGACALTPPRLGLLTDVPSEASTVRRAWRARRWVCRSWPSSCGWRLDEARSVSPCGERSMDDGSRCDLSRRSRRRCANRSNQRRGRSSRAMGVGSQASRSWLAPGCDPEAWDRMNEEQDRHRRETATSWVHLAGRIAPLVDEAARRGYRLEGEYAHVLDRAGVGVARGCSTGAGKAERPACPRGAHSSRRQDLRLGVAGGLTASVGAPHSAHGRCGTGVRERQVGNASRPGTMGPAVGPNRREMCGREGSTEVPSQVR